MSVLMIDLCHCKRGEGEENKSRLLSKLHLHKKWKSVAEESFAVSSHVCSTFKNGRIFVNGIIIGKTS